VEGEACAAVSPACAPAPICLVVRPTAAAGPPSLQSPPPVCRQFVVEEEARARVARGAACPLQPGPTPAPPLVDGHSTGSVVEAEVGALLATAHAALPSAQILKSCRGRKAR
jgi:hypothetical protein